VLLLLLLAGLGAVLGLAAPAQAEPNGDFLAALNNAGITYHIGPDAIGIGQSACQLMDQGHPEADVIKGMTEPLPGAMEVFGKSLVSEVFEFFALCLRTQQIADQR
jgi:Protein of unknown function (DUF732)